jgi:Ca-activated chloride channel family protein
MPKLMRCIFCGLLQDEPAGVKECSRCGGELAFESPVSGSEPGAYLFAQMELDQVKAPAGRNIDRYLIVTLRTPTLVPAEQAAPTLTGRPPLNFSAVLDISGSMQGEKLHQAKEAVRQAIHHLHDGDRFTLVTFSDNIRCVLEPTAVDDHLRKGIESTLQEITATGMTALDGGLEMSIKKASQNLLQNNLILLLSDGQANVGETDLEKIGQRSHAARKHGLTLSTLGVGSDYNEALMAEIAIQGGGRYYHVQSATQISAYLTGELGEAANLAARNTKLVINLPPGGMLMPLSAAYPAEITGAQASVTVGDIPCEVDLEIPLRLTLLSQPAGNRLSLDGQVDFQSPAGNLLSTSLNRVTVRFVSEQEFTLREGLVQPTAERVFKHLRAAQVLSTSRLMASRPQAGVKEVERGLDSVRAYSELVGTQEAQASVHELQNDLRVMAASPAQAKAQVHAAFKVSRSTKDFHKPGKDDQS